MQEFRTNLRHSLLSLLFVVASWSAPIKAAEIHLRADATIRGRVIRLGDVADVMDVDAARQKALLATDLMPVPADGNAPKLTQRQVQDILAARGVSLADHTFSGAREVRLAGGQTATTAKKTEIRANGSVARGAAQAAETAITRYLAEHVDAARDWRVEVRLTDEQMAHASAWMGRLQASGGSEPWHGDMPFSLRAGSESLVVDAFVHEPEMVVVAARSLMKGDVVQATDVALQPARRGAIQKGLFHSLHDAIGKEAVRAVNAGQILDNNYVQSAVLVRRGEVVTVFVHAAGVRLKTTARARQSGGKGDQIEVEPIGEKRRYFARISDVQVVEVIAGADANANQRN